MRSRLLAALSGLCIDDMQDSSAPARVKPGLSFRTLWLSRSSGDQGGRYCLRSLFACCICVSTHSNTASWLPFSSKMPSGVTISSCGIRPTKQRNYPYQQPRTAQNRGANHENFWKRTMCGACCSSAEKMVAISIPPLRFSGRRNSTQSEGRRQSLIMYFSCRMGYGVSKCPSGEMTHKYSHRRRDELPGASRRTPRQAWEANQVVIGASERFPTLTTFTRTSMWHPRKTKVWRLAVPLTPRFWSAGAQPRSPRWEPASARPPASCPH